MDADEVSPVDRPANRRRIILKEEGGDAMSVDAEIADIMSMPWDHEGAMVDELRKEGVDETVMKAAVGAMRLLNGISEELPDGVRETIEKLGTEMYDNQNEKLNSSKVTSPGMLDGSSGTDEDMDGSGSGADHFGSGRDGELSGRGSAPKVASDNDPDDDMDDDGVMKAGKEPYGDVTYADPGYQSDGKKRYPLDSEKHIRAAWSYINMPKNASKYSSSQVSTIKGRIRAAMKRIGADVSKAEDPDLTAAQRALSVIAKALRRKSQDSRASTPDDPDDDGDDDTDPDDDPDDDSVQKGRGGTVGTHAVPITKNEDGTWDFSGVPDEQRGFFQEMIAKQDKADRELAEARERIAKADEKLREKEIIAKAEEQFKTVAATDELVPVLKEAQESMSAESFAKLEAILATANERIEKGALFTEMGRSSLNGAALSGGDAWAKIEKAADDLVEKSDGLSHAQAVDRVLSTREGAELYSLYMRETGMGVA